MSRTPDAAEELVALLNSASGEITRQSALSALSENLRDPQRATGMADLLSDESAYIRYDAMYGLSNMPAKRPALPSGRSEQDIEPQLERWRICWRQTGRLKGWR